jgi:hypothetical protein
MASPKQPQSLTGFVIARISVRGVKNRINIRIPVKPVLYLRPVSTEKPVINSAVHISKARGRLRT